MKTSAGLLLFRVDGAPEGGRRVSVLVVHPSGPYNRRAPWSLPKGEVDGAEAPEQAARRETREEVGVDVTGPLVPLGFVDATKSRKRIFAFAAPLPPDQTPRCASWEIDGAEFVGIDEARRRLHRDQVAFLDRFVAVLSTLGVA